MIWFIAKNKPWRDNIHKWRYPSPEFRYSFSSFEVAYEALKTRKDDGAKCKIVLTEDWDEETSR